MSEKKINSRIINKHDIEAHWLLATNFIPKKGEIIVYDIEIDSDGNTLELPEDRTTPYTYERFKIGNGIDNVSDLPFSVGLSTKDGGEIFNDYGNNKALSEYSSASGYMNMAGCKAFSILGLERESDIYSEYYGCYYITINDTTGLSVGDTFSLYSEKLDKNLDMIASVSAIINATTFTMETDIVINSNGEEINWCPLDGTTTEYIWFPEKPELNGNRPTGIGANANGYSTKASQIGAHSEGYRTIAEGKYSHAEGNSTLAGYAAHSEGKGTQALGEMSHAEGEDSTASGTHAHAEGDSTVASGVNSHAQGLNSVASGIYAHAEGNSTTSSGNATHSEGSATKAIGDWSHSEGRLAVSYGDASHSEGNGTNAVGDASHSEGTNTRAKKNNSHTEGSMTTADGYQSHAEGNSTNLKDDITDSTELDVVLEAFGSNPFAYVKGNYGHGEGSNNIVWGNASHAEGTSTKAIGNNSHTEGNLSRANGSNSHAEGYNTLASGGQSHAEGSSSQATGTASHAGGVKTIASAEAQTSIGKYNEENTNALFIVGNGTGENSRSNAFWVDKNGTASVKYSTDDDNAIVNYKKLKTYVAANAGGSGSGSEWDSQSELLFSTGDVKIYNESWSDTESNGYITIGADYAGNSGQDLCRISNNLIHIHNVANDIDSDITSGKIELNCYDNTGVEDNYFMTLDYNSLHYEDSKDNFTLSKSGLNIRQDNNSPTITLSNYTTLPPGEYGPRSEIIISGENFIVNGWDYDANDGIGESYGHEVKWLDLAKISKLTNNGNPIYIDINNKKLSIACMEQLKSTTLSPNNINLANLGTSHCIITSDSVTYGSINNSGSTTWMDIINAANYVKNLI